MSLTRRVTVWRVRWTYPHWRTDRPLESRLFYHGRHAKDLAGRLEGRGAHVEVSRADQPVTFLEVEDWRR